MANVRSSITMTEEELEAFVRDRRTGILATLDKAGRPHLTAMWFALVDGEVVFETKAKSQKVVNIRRDPRITVLFESGVTYPELRGASFDGTAEVVENDEANRDYIRAVGRSVIERYTGPADDATPEQLDRAMYNRVAVILRPTRVRSWDHRKLGMDLSAPPSGSSAVDIRGWQPAPAP
ncbi:MAG: PPOX class F420-dependent oxidoreductase [Frankiaceae bacterium]|jgi:PPOX class probable F420-dependent enzyme|nr:PPOX class F420-dependent oxidoreductase [Frankiaceae bacterium]